MLFACLAKPRDESADKNTNEIESETEEESKRERERVKSERKSKSRQKQMLDKRKSQKQLFGGEQSFNDTFIWLASPL